jgi:hypothetical protein
MVSLCCGRRLALSFSLSRIAFSDSHHETAGRSEDIHQALGTPDIKA